MELDEFATRFRTIKQMGFVKSLRSGPTGIGYTLETLLDIRENNIFEPDLGTIELKTHRTRSNNLITLFTFNRKVWQIPPLEAIKLYGSLDRDGRKGLYYTLGLKPNSHGLFTYVQEDEISVRHINGQVLAIWKLDILSKRFMQKIPAMIFVSAFIEKQDGQEFFHFYRAQLLEETSADILAQQFHAENIVLDLRMHDDITRARNHGTGFRVHEDKLPLLFKRTQEIE